MSEKPRDDDDTPATGDESKHSNGEGSRLSDDDGLRSSDGEGSQSPDDEGATTGEESTPPDRESPTFHWDLDEAPLVALRATHKVYEHGEPVPALDGVSFDIPRNSYIAIMGPSGSGKSTLLNLVGCLDTPTAGTIGIDGIDVASLSEPERARVRGEKIGFVFQTFNLLQKLTAVENVEFPMVFQKVPRKERLDRAHDLLEQVGLGERADHRPSELSGGQRQRVAIARALANDPNLLLADEPTGSLDSETGRTIMGMLRQFHERGHTVLLVTHDRTIAEHADWILHMLDGHIESVEAVGGETRQVDRTEEVQ